MSSEKATAIVLRVVEWSESSSVVTLFTREFGKIRALAKGARRLKGPFESALDLLSLCRIVFLRKPADVLDLLTEAKLLRRFRPHDRDLAGLYAGYYIAELLGELTDDDDPHGDLFDLADGALAALAEGTDVSVCLLRFELVALRLLGHQPSLDKCVECGTEVGTTGRVAFGAVAGGALCPRCRRGKRQVVSVSAPGMEAMRQLAATRQGEGPVVDESVVDVPRTVRGELRGVLNHYLNHLVGRQLRTQRYLGR